MTFSSDPVQTLIELEELKRLKARYCRYIDTKQWDRWRSLFTEDVQFRGLSAPFKDLDEFIGAQQDRLADAQCVHHCHTSELELTGPNTARGVWAMSDYVECPWEGERRGFVGYGFYEEEYRREDGDWKISSLSMRRIRFDPLVGPPLPEFQWWASAATGERIPPGRKL